MSTQSETMAGIKAMSGFGLARLAGCGIPTNPTSPGTVFLTDLRDLIIGSVEYIGTESAPWSTAARYVREDNLDEIVREAPSVYAHLLWQQFTCLQAYLVTLGADAVAEARDAQSGPEHHAVATFGTVTLEHLARAALWSIADTLCSGLLDMIEKAAPDERTATVSDPETVDPSQRGTP